MVTKHSGQPLLRAQPAATTSCTLVCSLTRSSTKWLLVPDLPLAGRWAVSKLLVESQQAAALTVRMDLRWLLRNSVCQWHPKSHVKRVPPLG